MMGIVFKELLRNSVEASNETAGGHFIAREAIQLIVHCLFAGDGEALSKPGFVWPTYDLIAGTGSAQWFEERTASASDSQ